MGFWHLGNEIELAEQDFRLSGVDAIRNDAAIRLICAARQICLRFGRAWA